MQSIPSYDNQARPEVLKRKRGYGIFYGLTVGLSFAIATWGPDGYILSQSHAFYPWLKLIIGGILCSVTGGITGWLVARIDRSLAAIILWLINAGLFAWLVVALPLWVTPRVIGWFEPDFAKLVHYSDFEINAAFKTRVEVASMWVGIFVGLVGFLQLTLSESAMFSSALFSRFSPMIICIVLMGICSSILDGLNDEPLRSPIQGTDNLIQFAADHQGQKVDPAVARQMHLSSLRETQDLVLQPRRLAIGKYDEWLGEVKVLIRFGNEWVNCDVMYNQPTFCRKIAVP